MNAVRLWFLEGGSFMILLLVLGVPAALIGGVMHGVAARRWSLLVGALLVLVPAGTGAAGTVLGRRATEAALVGVDASEAAVIRQVGHREAGHPVRFGVGICVVGLIPLVVGEVRRGRRR